MGASFFLPNSVSCHYCISKSSSFVITTLKTKFKQLRHELLQKGEILINVSVGNLVIVQTSGVTFMCLDAAVYLAPGLYGTACYS
jgi:hypothetical protein